MKRMRGRNHRPNGGGGGGGGGFRNQQNGIPLNRNHVFDSSGPEMRVRGTAQQLFEKYQQLGRDAASSGDRVLGEAYYQHAEHYFRIISAINQAQGQPNGQPSGQPNGPQNGQAQQDRNGNQNHGDYNRRSEPNGQDVGHEAQTEARYEPRNPEVRQQENRQEPRRFEPRPYEPRNKQDFQPRHERNDRNDRNERPDRAERYRPETPVADAPIDISSALEAELAAAAGLAEPAGSGDQPTFVQAAPVEARAIPIIPDAPPPPSFTTEPATTEPAPDAGSETEAAPVKVPRPRGRPRMVKPDADELKLED